MMKKTLLALMLIIASIFSISQNIHASTEFDLEPSVNTGGLWHVEDGNRAYVFMRYSEDSTVVETGSVSDQDFPTHDYSLFTYWPANSTSDLSFSNTTTPQIETITNPNIDLYTRFVIEYIKEGSTSTTSIEYDTEVVDSISVRLTDGEVNPPYPSTKASIEVFIDGVEVLSSDGQITGFTCPAGTTCQAPYFGVKMYWEKSETSPVIDPGDTTTSEDPWDLLPETEGSPSNPIGDWGSVTDIEVDNQTVSFNINYLGTTYPVTPFVVEGDLDFLSKAQTARYFTNPTSGDRILYFSFSDTELLTARAMSEVTNWKGEALWNLSTNEIKVTDVLTVYNYIPEADQDGNIYAYFYMPDVEIDNLISVSSVLAYKYYDTSLFGGSQPGETQYRTVMSIRGETSSVNPTWVEDVYRTSFIAGGVIATAGTIGTIATIAGSTAAFVPGPGWILAGACVLTVAATARIADVNEWFAYDVEQIQHVTPSASLLGEINTYIAEQSGSDSFNVDTDKLYKLHLATLQDGDDVQILKDESHVTQVVWETNGEIFVAEEEYIDSEYFGPGTLPPANNSLDLSDEAQLIIYGLIGIASLIVVVKISSKKPALAVIILGIAIYYLYQTGLI